MEKQAHLALQKMAEIINNSDAQEIVMTEIILDPGVARADLTYNRRRFIVSVIDPTVSDDGSPGF